MKKKKHKAIKRRRKGETGRKRTNKKWEKREKEDRKKKRKKEQWRDEAHTTGDIVPTCAQAHKVFLVHMASELKRREGEETRNRTG